MRRLLLTLCLLLLGVTAGAQDFIRYYPPPFLGLTTNGTTITSTVPILLPNGTAGSPSMGFSADADGTGTGIYRIAADRLGIALNGTLFADFGFTSTQLRLVASIIPSVDTNFGLGDTTHRWAYAYVSDGVQSSRFKALTDGGAAVAVIRVPVATSGYQAGEVIWNAQSTDTTDFRTTEGRIRFAGVNKAGALTCTINVVGTDLTASSSANTLVCTWTNVVNTTNCDLSVTCTDNTAGSQTMTINVRADMPTTATLVFP